MRNARDEAQVKLGSGYEARVLEPSPPAIDYPPWFADDPPARGDTDLGCKVVSPVGGGDLLWEDAARENADLAEWCRERWLGPYVRLAEPPAELAETRLALHSLAEQVISPARRNANGKIALRYTLRGFGTPFFGADAQVRVEETVLVVQEGASERREPLGSIASAARHVGARLLGPAAPESPGEHELPIDKAACTCLGDWYGFCCSVLEELRAGAGAKHDPSRVQLWPEHFDLATELGSESSGARATYGGSPGDALHPEPYLYVGPWEKRDGVLWNATAFSGAELSYRELLAAPDQRRAALDFFRARLDAP